MSKLTANSTRFGLLEIDQANVIHVIGGVLGFPNSQEYVFVDSDSESPFRWLQSLNEPAVAFAVTDPKRFFPDYQISVKQEELAFLGIGKEKDVLIYVILSIDSNPQAVTANLQGPLLVNQGECKAKQIVVKGARYSTRQPLFSDS